VVSIMKNNSVGIDLSYEHWYGQEFWTPTDGTATNVIKTPKTITSATATYGTAGSYGPWVKLDVTSGWLDIDMLLVDDTSTADYWEVEFGTGSAGSEVGITRVRFYCGLGIEQTPAYVRSPLINVTSASSAIYVRARNQTAGSKTLYIWVGYHVYYYDGSRQKRVIKQDNSLNAEIISDHLHATEFWTPDAADNALVPAALSVVSKVGAVVGSYGAWVAAFTTSASYYTQIDMLLLSGLVDEYELEIGIGAGPTAITRVQVSNLGSAVNTPYAVRSPRIAPNTDVSVRVRNKSANSRTVSIHLGYHQYPAGV